MKKTTPYEEKEQQLNVLVVELARSAGVPDIHTSIGNYTGLFNEVRKRLEAGQLLKTREKVISLLRQSVTYYTELANLRQAQAKSEIAYEDAYDQHDLDKLKREAEKSDYKLKIAINEKKIQVINNPFQKPEPKSEPQPELPPSTPDASAPLSKPRSLSIHDFISGKNK